MREIEADIPKPENQAELQDAFRKFWAIATEAGREQAEFQIKELNETQLGLIEENDRLQAELQAEQTRGVELEKSQSGLTQELRKALEAAEKARGTGESYSSKFADALERIERIQIDNTTTLKTQRENFDKSIAEAEGRIQKLQADSAAERSEHVRRLEIAQTRVHEVEVVLARTETKLEAATQNRLTKKQ